MYIFTYSYIIKILKYQIELNLNFLYLKSVFYIIRRKFIVFKKILYQAFLPYPERAKRKKLIFLVRLFFSAPHSVIITVIRSIGMISKNPRSSNSAHRRNTRSPVSSSFRRSLSPEREELHNEFMGNERALGNEGTNDSLSTETSRAGTKQPLRRFRCRKSNVVSSTTVRDSGNSYRPAAVVATQEILEPRAAVSLPLITVYDVSKCRVTNETCVVTSRATHVRGIAICTVDRPGSRTFALDLRHSSRNPS